MQQQAIPIRMEHQIEIIGHRGARGLFPENTIDGFINTIKLGVRTLELDVVISKDNQVVVSHEPWMHYKFCTEPNGQKVKMRSLHNLYKMDYAEIKKYDCGKRGHGEFPKQRPSPAYKPLLVETIRAIENYSRTNGFAGIEYIIEIKSHDKTDNLFHPPPPLYAKLVNDELQKLAINERLVVKSFDVRPLQEMRQLDPSLRIGLLVANMGSVKKNLDRLGFTPYTYNPSHRIAKQKNVDEAHQMGMKVMAWTVNDISEMQRMRAIGVDGIITDYPDVAFTALGIKQAVTGSAQ